MSLRTRAFKIPGHIIYYLATDNPQIPHHRRIHVTNVLFRPTDAKSENSLEQLERASRQHHSDRQRIGRSHEVHTTAEEINEPLGDSHKRGVSLSGTQPKFQSLSSREGRKVLRSASSQAAAGPSHSGSQLIRRNRNPKIELMASDDLLYPYNRRPSGWNTDFYQLFPDSQSNKPEQSRVPERKMSQHLPRWAGRLTGLENIDKAICVWQKFDFKIKQIRWPTLILKCLLKSTELALRCLFITNVKPFPPFEAVMDVLLFIKRRRGDEVNSSAELRRQYMQVLSEQRRQTARWPSSMKRKHLDLFIEECSGDEGRVLFELLGDTDTNLSYESMLVFMDYFTAAGDPDMAIKALKHICPEARLRSDQHLLSRCTNLLKLDSIVFDGNSPNFRILPQILEAGVKPDMALCNLIMKNAVRKGFSAVAWDLLRYVRDHGLQPNTRTYSILVQDALARGNSEGLQEILTTIKNQPDLSDNHYLMVCTLNVIRIQGKNLKLSPRVVFSNMLAVYCRIFSTAPLRHLRLIDEKLEPLPDSGQPEPDIKTLAYVVKNYVMLQQSSEVVQSLLDRIAHLIAEGDDMVRALAQCLPFYDGVISFFARRRNTFPKCLQIVQSMLDRNICPPAATWNMLAFALTKHGHFQAAVVVRNIMLRQVRHQNSRNHRPVLKQSPSDNFQHSPGVALQAFEALSGGILSDGYAVLNAEQVPQLEKQDMVDALDDVRSYISLHPIAQADQEVEQIASCTG